jgi:hypothetical protein
MGDDMSDEKPRPYRSPRQDYDDYVTLAKEIGHLRSSDGNHDDEIDRLESLRCKSYHALGEWQSLASRNGLAPDYVVCVKHTREDKKLSSWCGRYVSVCGFMFQDIDHAVHERMAEGRLLICPACRDEIVYTLEEK